MRFVQFSGDFFPSLTLVTLQDLHILIGPRRPNALNLAVFQNLQDVLQAPLPQCPAPPYVSAILNCRMFCPLTFNHFYPNS